MERKMAENLVGNLFWVDIHLPLKRSEVRDLIVARDNFIKNLMEQKNLNEMQASLDASDMLIDFCTQLSDEDSAHLSQILQEESMAVMPPIADTFDQIEKETQSHIEAATSHIEAQAIFNELSANLQVYGSNSGLTGARPANVDLAIEHINRSLELEPNNAAYLNLKGLLLWQGKKDKDAGLALIKRAAELNPRDINIQHNLKAVEDPKGCFIATASYGTPVAYEINELRYWRDTKLSKNVYGRIFINTYYKVSPPIARLIANSPKAKKIVRKMLRPLIIYLKSTNSK